MLDPWGTRGRTRGQNVMAPRATGQPPGVRHIGMPVTPQRVWAAISAARQAWAMADGPGCGAGATAHRPR